MMRIPPGFLPLIMTVVFIVHGVCATSLREQLNAATVDEDSHAQIDLIRRLLDQAPDDALQRRLVTLWIAAADYGMAERVLQNWKSAPEGFRTIAEADILLARDRNRAEALAKLESSHARQPEDREVTLRLVEVLSDQKDNARIDEILTVVPGVEVDAGLLLRRARARRSLTKFEQALKDFATADQIDPEGSADDRPAFERLGAALPEINLVTKKLAAGSDNFELRIVRAQLYRDGGADSGLIAAEAEAAQTINPGSVAATLLYAVASQSRKMALEEYSVDLRQPPPSAKALRRLAELDVRLSQNPRDAKALASRSFLLNEATGQSRLALRDAEAALEIEGNRSLAHRERIFALTQLNWNTRAAEALAAMERAKVSRLDLARAYGTLAVAELESYRYEAALAYATRSIEAEASAQRYQTRATILQRLGRVAQAREDLQKAKALEEKP